MKTKLLIVAALTLASSCAFASQYTCTVHCVSPSGTTTTTVKAGSASEAAKIVDGQSDQICRAAGHGKSTSSTMSASQCK
ncbi:MAG: hypothetical protein U1D25_07145 [Hydrogenophaga sp.]|uniref:hypothetical protein n=1 Tax=Hydrogenophaga sp. TaxID=1904254 RepID=UPI002AB8A8C9|nr:hypothetical protein [Hydrogenophaga sp.]MDZ4187865.1 hypothetical protein [Hydrogenophaga sp.]